MTSRPIRPEPRLPRSGAASSRDWPRSTTCFAGTPGNRATRPGLRGKPGRLVCPLPHADRWQSHMHCPGSGPIDWSPGNATASARDREHANLRGFSSRRARALASGSTRRLVATPRSLRPVPPPPPCHPPPSRRRPHATSPSQQPQALPTAATPHAQKAVPDARSRCRSARITQLQSAACLARLAFSCCRSGRSRRGSIATTSSRSRRARMTSTRVAARRRAGGRGPAPTSSDLTGGCRAGSSTR
jgi:hypothetical protein